MEYHRLPGQLARLTLIALLLAGCNGAPVEPTAIPTSVPPTPVPTRSTPSPTPLPMRTLEGKRSLFVIYEQFEEREYGEPRAILEDLGCTVVVASSSLDPVTGHKGAKVQPDISLSDAHGSDYDAVVFVGGYQYERDDPEAQRIAREGVAAGKIVAAICIAPITLAKAGVVEGKRVTASTGADELKQAGATFTGASVERDGLIITANGPGMSSRFGKAVAAALEE